MTVLWEWVATENSRNHKLQCDLLEDPSIYAVYSREYGINHRTSLMDLKYFNPCSGALVPDMMHDGCAWASAPMWGKTHPPILCWFYMKYFQLTHLTQIMETFEFGYMEMMDRPTPKENAELHWLLTLHLTSLSGTSRAHKYFNNISASELTLNQELEWLIINCYPWLTSVWQYTSAF